MKQLRLWLLGLFALCGIAAVAQEAKADSTGYIVKVGQTAPDFTVTLTDGKTVKLSDFRGKVVMLQFTVGAAYAVKKCLLSKKIYGRSISPIRTSC